MRQAGIFQASLNVLDVKFTYVLKKKCQMKKIFVSALTILLMASMVLTAFSYAQFNVRAESESQIRINGLVSHPFNFTLADLQAMPQTTVQATLFCVSAPTTPLEKGNWRGVKLWTLLSQAGISSSATKIAFYASDGFSTDLTIDACQRP